MTRTATRRERKAEEGRQHRLAFVAQVATPCEPICAECEKLATQMVSWSQVYTWRPGRPDLTSKKFWLCDCGAFVGCHEGTTIPLGRPAKKALQRLRSRAHEMFDPLWQAKAAREKLPRHEAREAGYAWLAGQLGLTRDKTHIGMMDKPTVTRMIDLLTGLKGKRE